MKRRAPLGVIFAVALTVAALLPLYLERTMTELMFADGSGGAIQWGWRRCTLREFCADYSHMAREQEPAQWFAINLALLVVYASVASFGLAAGLKCLATYRDRQMLPP
ncbi:MAG: hypothetical protein ACJ8NS_00395 [Chthoniobacterales bacterium]